MRDAVAFTDDTGYSCKSSELQKSLLKNQVIEHFYSLDRRRRTRSSRPLAGSVLIRGCRARHGTTCDLGKEGRPQPHNHKNIMAYP